MTEEIDYKALFAKHKEVGAKILDQTERVAPVLHSTMKEYIGLSEDLLETLMRENALAEANMELLRSSITASAKYP